MSLINRISGAAASFRAAGTVPAATDDFWYAPIGRGSGAGVQVTADRALNNPTVLSCVLIIARAMAAMPLNLRKRRPGGRGSDLADQHPVFDLLYAIPNNFQTAFEFIMMMQGHVELRGNAYAEIIPGPRGFCDQLIPLHPDRITPEVLRDTGMLRYRYADPLLGVTRYIFQPEMFHLRSLSSSGYVGLSTIEMAAETIGGVLAAQDYGNRFFANDAKPGVVITGGKFKSKEDKEEFRSNWQFAQSGENRHKVAVLPEGLEIKELGMKNSDSQYVESRKMSRSEIAAIFGVPHHMLGSDDKASTYASVEQFSIQFVMDCLLPRCKMWEQAIYRDLILSPQYFAKFNLTSRLRGDLKSRYDAYKIGREGSWLSVNDILEFEDMNPIGPEGDTRIQPMNFAPLGTKPEPTAAAATQARLALLASSCADRSVRKEVAAVNKLRERNPNGTFAGAVREFYAEHAGWLSDTLRIPRAAAESYCNANLDRLLATEDTATWCADVEREGVQRLAKLATEVIQ